nr:hypothetical protein [Tanacetum cinerariifolium]
MCEAFNNFNHLLKIDKDLFTFDIQRNGTNKEYKLNNPVTKEPSLNNEVPYKLCDHICEQYRFKNGIARWPTCSSDVDGFCNGGMLCGIVRVGSMTYFQNHKWYDELVDGKLKDETLAFKGYDHRKYANIKLKWAHDPYLEVNNIFGRNNDIGNTQDNQIDKERMDDPTLEPSVCKIKTFKMMKYSFNDDEE